MPYNNTTDAKDAFLEQANARILEKDFSTATDKELIIASALIKVIDAVNSSSTINLDPLFFFKDLANLETHLNNLKNRQTFVLMLSDLSSMSIIANSATAMSMIANSATAMSMIANGVLALNAIVSSTVALKAIADSAVAKECINASAVFMEALYNSPLISKQSFTLGFNWSTETGVTIRNESGLFVRLSTKGTAAWGEGVLGGEWFSADGVQTLYSGRTANPYNHTAQNAAPRLKVCKFNKLVMHGYSPYEIAYIPL